jgi:large subunit ribosomal protein L13
MWEVKVHLVRTYSPKPGEITRQWHVIDATDVVLGRLASHIATLLRGKHKPTYAPHVDTGDSGYPGGLRSTSYETLLETNPRRVIEKAVKGMLPHNRIGRQQLSKLKVYSGPQHPHTAQQPQPFTISQVAQ